MSNSKINTFKRTTINLYNSGYDRKIISVNGKYYRELPSLYSLYHILRSAAACKAHFKRSYSREEVADMKEFTLSHSIVINHNGAVWMDGHCYATLPEDSSFRILRPTL
jgi:hypothetical protein